MESTSNIGKRETVKQNDQEKGGPHPINEKAQKRLRIIGGQVRGIQKMIEEEKYCIDILTQISAARAAMNSVAKIIFKRHIGNCVANAIKGNGETSRELLDELMQVFIREGI
ncbi:MAG TPA: transcriptional regulator [Spirochaetes bacterium]|nr:transcriptional regulator [Spirochaetota bacterium]